MTTAPGRLGDLYEELKRRHVFRVAAVYAAGAFAVLQVVDIAFPALNLPPWATTSVVVAAFLGFPVAIVLGWLGERSAPVAAAGIPRGSGRGGGAAALPSATLAVFPFKVRGHGEFGYLGEGLVDLLSGKLRTGELRSVDPRSLLTRGAREAGEAGDPDRARRVAERFGADLFVLGNILEASGQLSVDATLYSARPRLTVLSEVAAQGTAGEVFALVDDLARQLLTALTDGPAARLTRLAVCATDSFPALKAYLEGESEMRAMRRAAAAEAFRTAVRHDPTFALAWYRLSVAALWSAQLELSRDAIEQAAASSERLADHDRMLVEAFAAFLRGEAGMAERLYRTIVGNHPDDMEAWYQLGETLFHYGPKAGSSLRDSRDAWERVLALEPEHMSALAHMAVIAACEDDWDEVDRLVARATEISPEGDAITWMQALQAWGSGDRAAQERVRSRLRASSDFAAARAAWYVALPCRTFEGATELSKLLSERTRSPDAQAVGGVWLAYLELAQGRVRGAYEQLAAVSRANPNSALLHRSLFRLLPFLDTSTADLESTRDRVGAWDVASIPRCITTGAYFTVHNGLHAQLQSYLLGMLAARLKDKDGALDRAAALREMGGRPEARDLACDQAQAIDALVEIDQGRAESALAKLEDACTGALHELAIASPFYSRTLERWLRAELLEKLGRDREAIRWYGTFAEHSIYDLIYLAPSHLRRAEIEERLGHTQQAADHYRAFLELWSDPDPDLRPRVDRARERLTQLAGSG